MLEPHSTAEDSDVTTWGVHVLNRAKSQLGRQQLIQLGITISLSAVLSRQTAAYSASTDTLLTYKVTWTLRLIRNTCAAGESACLAFLDQRVVPSVLSLLAKVHETDNCEQVSPSHLLTSHQSACSPGLLKLICKYCR